MTNCMRCNASLKFFETLSLLGKPKVCTACEKQIADILQLLELQMQQASDQYTLTEQFRAYLSRALENNRIPQEYSFDLFSKLDYLLKVQAYQKFIADIRSGNLPVVRVNAILDTDE